MARKKENLIDSPLDNAAKLREMAKTLGVSNKVNGSLADEPLYPDVDGLVFEEDNIGLANATEWIQSHRDFLMSLCFKYKWIDEIDDLFQVVCISVFENFEKYDPHQRDVKQSTYYWHCAENAILYHGRKMIAKKRVFDYGAVMEFYGGSAATQVDEDGVIALITGSGEDSLMETENYAFWMDAIGKLPSIQRDTMRLVIKGRTQTEIAAILGKSQPSVASYIKQARATLNELRKVVA